MAPDSPTLGGPYLRPFVGVVPAVSVLTALAPRALVGTFTGRLITIRPLLLVAAVLGSLYFTRESRRAATREKQRVEALDIDMPGRARHPRPDLHFPRGSTIIDEVRQQARRMHDILNQMQRMTREHVATTTPPL